MKILLAEDDPNIAVVMQICLEKIGGHEVVLVDDGEEAANRAKSETFDLIVLDGMLPKKTGLRAAHEIRDCGNQTPIIFLSAKLDEAELRTFGSGYIPKPFDPNTICGQIDDILRSSKGGTS